MYHSAPDLPCPVPFGADAPLAACSAAAGVRAGLGLADEFRGLDVQEVRFTYAVRRCATAAAIDIRHLLLCLADAAGCSGRLWPVRWLVFHTAPPL